MPNRDGFKVLDELRNDEAAAATPVVILTQMDLSPEDRKALGSRVLFIAEKGNLTEAELLKKLNQALGG